MTTRNPERITQNDNGSNCEEQDISEDLITEDKYRITFILFYAFGLLSQLPTNFYSTPTQYWMYKFRDPSIQESWQNNGSNRTDLQRDFTSTYNTVSTVLHIVSIIGTIQVMKLIGLEIRMIVSFAIMLLAYVATIILVPIDSDSWQKTFFILTLVIGAFLTGGCGIFVASLFEMAVRFPRQYFAALFSGQSIGGIVSSLINVIVISFSGGPQEDALLYFFIGAAFVATCACMYWTIYTKSAYFRHHYQTGRVSQERNRANINRKMLLDIVVQVKWYIVAVVLLQGATGLIYPGLTALVVSQDQTTTWGSKLFNPVCSYLIYNLMDFMGRELAIYTEKPSDGRILAILGVLRWIFVPLLIFCNAQPRKYTEVVFHEDYVYAIFVILFSFSNGYLINMCILQAPKNCDPRLAKLAALVVMVFWLVVSAFSFLNKLLLDTI